MMNQQQLPQEIDATKINVAPIQPKSNEMKPINKAGLKYQIGNQTLGGTSFLPSIRCSIIFSVLLGVIMTLLGIIVLVISGAVHETLVRYDNQCQVGQQTDCEVQFDLKEQVKAPVFIYLQVDKYYQNHRNYVKSISFDQLGGKEISASTAESKCDPVIRNKDIADIKTTSVGGQTLNAEAVVHPCGLQAKSFREDTFSLQSVTNTKTYTVVDNDIAWSVDKNHKFKNLGNYNDVQYLNVQSDRFMNWMSFSTLFNWKKLWGKIDETLEPGKYAFQIRSALDVEKFGGRKYFLISNVSALGGTSSLLGTLLLIMGLAYILLAFAIVGFVWCKKLNDDQNYRQLNFEWR